MTLDRTARTCGDSGGKRKDGAVCCAAMNLSASSGLCVQHDPERAGARAAMQAAGGHASKVAKTKAKAADPATCPPVMRTLQDAVAVAAWITNAVLRGELDARTAESATKAVRQFQLGEEKADLLRRIKALELSLKTAKANV
jgi:hypothetical protein